MKFSIGEIAIFVDIQSPDFTNHEVWIGFFAERHNQECEIIELLPHLEGYRVKFADGTFARVDESCLRKRRPPSEERFRDTLKPCDKQFPAQLDRWLRPVKVTDDLKARMRRVFPSPEEISWTPTRASILPTGWSDVTARLQPFDHFFGAFDA